MVAAPLATMALTGGFDGEGRLVVYLPDGRKLEGRWAVVTERRPATALTIETPSGLISAADLASPDLPAFFGGIDGPPLGMICAFVGDEFSGYRCRCADHTGAEWVGAVGNPYGPNRGFNDDLVVSLREAARSDIRNVDGAVFALRQENYAAGSR